MEFKLITSNKNKLDEFIRLASDMSFSIEKGLDLKEVKSNDPVEVALYKSIEAGVGSIVEDTILIIDGEEVTDIRYRLDELKHRQGSVSLSWVTTLAVCYSDRVELYKGVVGGKFQSIEQVPSDAFGFDPFFIPDGTDKDLYRLEKDGLKDHFSARKLAIDALRSGLAFESILLRDVPEWRGEYQS